MRSFEQMIAEVNGLDVNDVLQRDIDELVQEYPVAGIDPENTVYLDYVGLDAALPVHLMPHLVERHDELVGDPDAAEEIRRVQFDAAAMFAWDGAHGYEIDVDVLDRFVVQYQKDFADSSLNFRREVRQIMGWEEQEPKEGDGVVSETTSTPAWSL